MMENLHQVCNVSLGATAAVQGSVCVCVCVSRLINWPRNYDNCTVGRNPTPRSRVHRFETAQEGGRASILVG
jgi:hypothetical protein